MKNSKILILLFVSALIFSSCGIINQDEKEFIRSAFSESLADSAYLSIRPVVQKFEISTDKPATIVAEGGTKIFIPNDCFIDDEGNSVRGTVQIELVEAFSLTDFITSGLTTLSDDKLLLSNGMLFIDAKSSGKSLQLNDDSKLTVSLPTIHENNGFQMFTGDGKNWSVDSSMLESDYLIPLPLDLLYPRGNDDLVHCYQNKNGVEKKGYYDTTVISLTDAKYENTLIATEEFRDRIGSLIMMMHNMSDFELRDYYFDKVDCFGCKYDPAIFKVYYDNLDTPIEELDKKTRQTYIGYYRQNKDELLVFFEEVNKHKQNYYYNWTDTNYYFDFRKMSFEEQYMYRIDDYAVDGKKGKVKIMNDYGIDLNADNAYEQLLALKVEPKEINSILQYNFKRQAIIDRLTREKKAIEDKDALAEMYETTVFSTKTLGWINCDMFYKDPDAGKAEIILTDNSANKLNFIDFSLVIPDLNVRLMSFKRSDGLYSFTKEDGPYTKLPIGRNAFVVGVSLQNDSVFFASKNIKIEDGLKLDFNMKHISKANLKDSLQFIFKQPS